MIGFLAKRQRGKDTASDYLINKKGYTKYAFAEPLKRGIQQWFGFTDEQLFTDEKENIDKNWGVSPRKVCQIIGTDVVRDMFPKIYSKKLGIIFGYAQQIFGMKRILINTKVKLYSVMSDIKMRLIIF